MCFHNSRSRKAKELAIRYNKKTNIIDLATEVLDECYHVSAFLNPDYPIITSSDQIQDYKWGLIPFWAKTEDQAFNIRKGTYNARAETIYKKPSFRASINHNRCIIPSTGYFEYHNNEDGSKTPYFIYTKDQGIFSIAGVSDSWENPATGEIVKTFSMITTDANELTGWIHNGGKNPQRMPVILQKEDEEKWLDPKSSRQEIESLLKPFPADLMDAYPINSDFIRKNPSDSTIIEPDGDLKWKKSL